MATLDGIKRMSYSDIHVHIEPIDMVGRQFATAYIKFVSVLEAERAVEMLEKLQGPHLKYEITDVEDLYRIRDGANKGRARGPSIQRSSMSDAKSLFDLDIVMVRRIII
jgi:hypothetical protein